jgi:hypothetical protein
MRIASLISEDDKNVSLGRVAFWILLGIACYFWFKEIKFPDTLYYFFAYVTIYNFGKKALSTITEVVVPKLKSTSEI